MKTIAIMQPTYLPWIGYFAMMESVDQFVLLDSVQFAKRSWQQRNRIKTPNGPQWLTVPVLSSGKQSQLLESVEIDPDSDFPRKHTKAIELNYRKAPYFADYFPLIVEVMEQSGNHLAELNINLIQLFARCLQIETPTVRSRELTSEGGKGERLLNICTELNAQNYVSPPGSREYLEASGAFDGTAVELSYFEYNPAPYPQLHGPFEPYMNIADLLFNCGPESPAKMMEGVAATRNQ